MFGVWKNNNKKIKRERERERVKFYTSFYFDTQKKREMKNMWYLKMNEQTNERRVVYKTKDKYRV